MKMNILATAGILLYGLSAVFPAVAQENSVVYEDVAAEEMALMELYFGDDQLVEAATRYPKPISQVAENVTIVTAEKIEAMHAHTVAEVLERVPGVFVQFSGEDFAPISSLHIHGSDYEHVLVLVDGIRWNNVNGDFAETNNIPVHIIDRIEVIKGAASSAWGSSLGGVVNIITKKTGSGFEPRGTAALAVGEHDTEHYHGELAGGLKDFGYYLYAGRRESGGILNDRFFDAKSLFGKFSYELPGRTKLGAEIGYTQPENRYLNADPLAVLADYRILFYAADLESTLTEDLHFYLQLYGRDQRNADIGLMSDTVFSKDTFDEEQQGINTRLALEGKRQTLVLGAEYLDRQNITRNDLAGTAEPRNNEEIWAFYLNDTIRLGRLTVTPGVRYDHLSVADDEVNPSLGVTYRLSDATLLRSAVARGFRKPTVFLEENFGLESEAIWTYQAGAETTAIPCLWLKATLFHHDADEVWIQTDTGDWLNDDSEKRTGLEVALKTVPFHDFSLGANYTFVHLDPDRRESDDLYKVNLQLEYANDPRGLSAQLAGKYVWWSDVHFSPPAFQGHFDNFIWDFVIHKQLMNYRQTGTEIFFKVHNLFNGSQYWLAAFPNAPRWVEAGVKLHF